MACLFYPETHPTLLTPPSAITAPPTAARYVFAVFIHLLSLLSHHIISYHTFTLRLSYSSICQAIDSYAANNSAVNGTRTGPHSSTHKILLFVASDNLGNQEESCIPYCTLLWCQYSSALHCTVLPIIPSFVLSIDPLCKAPVLHSMPSHCPLHFTSFHVIHFLTRPTVLMQPMKKHN